MVVLFKLSLFVVLSLYSFLFHLCNLNFYVIMLEFYIGKSPCINSLFTDLASYYRLTHFLPRYTHFTLISHSPNLRQRGVRATLLALEALVHFNSIFSRWYWCRNVLLSSPIEFTMLVHLRWYTKFKTSGNIWLGFSYSSSWERHRWQAIVTMASSQPIIILYHYQYWNMWNNVYCCCE